MKIDKTTKTITAEHWERCAVANYLANVVRGKDHNQWSVHFVQKSPVEDVKSFGR